MTKNCKKMLITVFLTLFAACLFLFTACNDDKAEDNAVTYTVTVMTDATTPAAGVKVAIRKGGATYESKTTDENGKVEFELVPDSYEIALSSLPAHYSLAADADVSLTAEKHSLTVTLSENFSYKVSLVNPDGTPFYAEGVRVGICTLSGNCLTPELLGTDGVARCEADKGDYHVQILNLPATATFEKDADGYYTGENFSAEKTEMTITVYPVTSVTAATPMTDAEKTAYAAKNAGYTVSELTAYHFTQTLAAGETAYFSLTPAYDGEFNIYKDTKASYLYNDTTFQKGNNGNGLYAAFPVLTADTTYFFNVSNTGNEEITAEFVIEALAASYSKTVGAGTVNVSFTNKNVNAVIELTPAIGASYKLTAIGEQLTAFAVCTSSYVAKDFSHGDEAFAKNAELSVKFTPNNIGGSLYISVAVKGVTSYPVDFQISIEKIADITNTTTVVEATETLAVYTKPEGQVLTAVPYGTAESAIVLGQDGYYRYDNSVVMVVLTKVIDEERLYLDNPLALAYMDGTDIGGANYVFNVTSDADKADFTKGETYHDYRMLIRGFNDYVITPSGRGNTYELPETVADSYAKFANADGAYPLTEALKTFLKGFCRNNINMISYGLPMDGSCPEGNEWLFPLYYYAEPDITTPDDVVMGDYKLVSFVEEDKTYKVGDEYYGATVTENDYLLTVKNQSFTIRRLDPHQNSYDTSFTGTWSKGQTEGQYTFVDPTEYSGDTFTVSYDAATQTITLTGEYASFVFKKATT